MTLLYTWARATQPMKRRAVQGYMIHPPDQPKTKLGAIQMPMNTGSAKNATVNRKTSKAARITGILLCMLGRET